MFKNVRLKKDKVSSDIKIPFLDQLLFSNVFSYRVQKQNYK